MKSQKQFVEEIKERINQSEKPSIETEGLQLLKYCGKLSESILENNKKEQKNYICEIFSTLVIMALIEEKEIWFIEDEYDSEDPRFVGGTYQEYLSEILEYFHYEFNGLSLESLENLIHCLFTHEGDLTEFLNEKYS